MMSSSERGCWSSSKQSTFRSKWSPSSRNSPKLTGSRTRLRRLMEWTKWRLFASETWWLLSSRSSNFLRNNWKMGRRSRFSKWMRSSFTLWESKLSNWFRFDAKLTQTRNKENGRCFFRALKEKMLQPIAGWCLLPQKSLKLKKMTNPAKFPQAKQLKSLQVLWMWLQIRIPTRKKRKRTTTVPTTTYFHF